MSDREPRDQWSVEHREVLTTFEKAVGIGAALVGSYMAYNGSGVGSYAGVGLASVGAWRLFPSFRPVMSKLIDMIPRLPKSTGPEG